VPKKRIIIIGGGAAGIFAAANAARLCPDAAVTVVEKSNKLLSKVKVSGGGRCNVTTSIMEIPQLVKNYPRGEKELRTVFKKFSPTDTVEWFESRGAKLKTEADGRMFPVTDDSQTIIDVLLNECREHGVKIHTGRGIASFEKQEGSFLLTDLNGSTLECDKFLIATGGSPSTNSYKWLEATGHKIIPPLPSLFTFNVKASPIVALNGISVKEAQVKIAGTKLSYSGPLLITHWGFSGPAVLKLSAFGAETLHEKSYRYTVIINWLNGINSDEADQLLTDLESQSPSKKVCNARPTAIPDRLWNYLAERSNIPQELKWNGLRGKHRNRLINTLICDEYPCEGKTTFKEEFVTCGGIDLKEVDMNTMESKKVKGLYFAGELLNMDGITGGFNFQAAWATGFVAAKAITDY
jgi:predicted Rossmann fold flavoprotein